jgi:hypothetical protein
MAILLCLGVSACAGTGNTRGTAAGNNIDYGKVLAVNQWATRRHATVVWIQYPVRREKAAHNDG